MSGEIRVQAIRANLRAEAQVATTAILDVARRLGHPIAFRPVRKMLIAERDLRAWVEARSPGLSEPRRSRWPSRSRREVPGSVALIREMDPGL